MSIFQEGFEETTRGRIVELLRQSSRTVGELATLLQLTDNAVRAHLTGLEREGFVAQVGLLPGSRKPNTVYGLTAKAEALYARAATPVLSTLLTVLQEQWPEAELRAVLAEVGHRLAAPHRGAVSGKPLPSRIRYAADLIGQLGGVARLEVGTAMQFVQGGACPLGEAAAAHPALCQVVETLLSDLLDVPVREECEKGARPRCRFRLGG